MQQPPILFPGWKDALARSILPPIGKASQTKAIISFLPKDKVRRNPASIGFIKRYRDELAGAGAEAPARAALGRFSRASRGLARRQAGAGPWDRQGPSVCSLLNYQNPMLPRENTSARTVARVSPITRL